MLVLLKPRPASNNRSFVDLKSQTYLEVSTVLWRVLEGPQGSDQSRQLLGHLSLGLAALLLHHPVGFGLLVVRLIASVLLQSQILGEELRVAQALQNSVHETGVAVVFQSGHAGDFVSGEEAPAVALIRGDGALGFGFEGGESSVVLVRCVQLGSEVRKRRESLEDSAHETPDGAHGAPAEELLTKAGLFLFTRSFARHDCQLRNREMRAAKSTRELAW